MEWLKKQYHDIKGNAKWAVLAALWWVVTNWGRRLLQLIPNMPNWLIWSILLALSVVVFFWVAKTSKISAVTQPTAPQAASHGIGIPTLSALHGQQPKITFNAQEMFRLSYFSPLTAEVEQNIRIVAAQASPADHEAFYARFIGVGLIAYAHDNTWWTIFKSQILMLERMNSANGVLPLGEAKKFYEQATIDYASIYANYSFEQWLTYMKGEQLLVRHPSDMLEITHKGKDFLKYLAHWGRNAQTKRG